MEDIVNLLSTTIVLFSLKRNYFIIDTFHDECNANYNTKFDNYNLLIFSILNIMVNTSKLRCKKPSLNYSEMRGYTFIVKLYIK